MRIRLIAAQIIKLSLYSYFTTLAVLLVIRYAFGEWLHSGSIPAWAWVVGLTIPVLDILLGLAIYRATRRVALARAPLFSGIILGLFVAWTLWSWK